MQRFLLSIALTIPILAAQQPQRSRITGVAHIALFVHDVDKSRVFYKDFLGYGEPFKLDKPDGGLSLTFIKINDRQYIELFPETAPGTDRLNHISIETDNAESMRAYLESKGLKVPAKVGKGRIANSTSISKTPTATRSRSCNTNPTAGVCARRVSS
jgi:hypothetical protein